MTVYKYNICEIKKYSQVKLILAFTIDFVRSCSLIHYIYTIHTILLNLDDVRTKNRFFGCLILCSSTINICCQKENRLDFVPFAANDVFRIMEITFTSFDFIICFQFDRTNPMTQIPSSKSTFMNNGMFKKFQKYKAQ